MQCVSKQSAAGHKPVISKSLKAIMAAGAIALVLLFLWGIRSAEQQRQRAYWAQVIQNAWSVLNEAEATANQQASECASFSATVNGKLSDFAAKSSAEQLAYLGFSDDSIDDVIWVRTRYKEIAKLSERTDAWSRYDALKKTIDTFPKPEKAEICARIQVVDRQRLAAQQKDFEATTAYMQFDDRIGGFVVRLMSHP